MLVTGVIGWAALSGTAVWLGGPAIEHDLATRARAALAAADVPGEVSVDGRRLTVVTTTGRRDEVLDALAAAEHPVSFDARSVRIVTEPTVTAATVPPPTVPSPTLPPTTVAPSTVPPTTVPPTTTVAPTQTAPATTGAPATVEPLETTAPASIDTAGDPAQVAVRARLDERGGIELTGRVFSVVEEAALVVTAEAVVGADRVTNALVVSDGDTVVGDAHVAGLVRVVALFGTDLVGATAELVDGTVHIAGGRPAGSAIERLTAAIRAGEADGVQFDLRLDAIGAEGTEG